MTELEALVQQQRSERRLGPFQPPQPFVSVSLNKGRGPESGRFTEGGFTLELADALSADGGLRRSNKASRWDGCAVHGRKGISLTPRGRLRCWLCEQDHRRLAATLEGREFNPYKDSDGNLARHCDHPADQLTLRESKGRVRTICRECERQAQRLRYAQNPEAGREKAKASYQKHRAKKLAYQKRYREQMRNDD